MAIRRPKVRPHTIPGDLDELASRCEYLGSRVHKDQRSWLGLPTPRQSPDPSEVATICPLISEEERRQATEWIRTAIRRGQFSRTDWRNGFPRRIWHRDNSGKYWYGVLTNSGAGQNPRAQYKGWPISEEEKNEIFS
jgi:hypothetical protein